MKKIFLIPAVFALVALFSVPSFVAAQSCQSPCIQGLGNLSGQCFAPDGVSACVTSVSGSGVNQQWLVFYKDAIVSAVNDILVPVLMAIAFIVFLWGVYKYFIYGADNDTERETGRKFTLWGVIGFVVILSIWGLVNIVKTTILPAGASNVRPDYPKL